ALQGAWPRVGNDYRVSADIGSNSVDAASQYCGNQGIRALLHVPIDVPLALPEDIERVFHQSDTHADAVIVPSGTGTGYQRDSPIAARLVPRSFWAQQFFASSR